MSIYDYLQHPWMNLFYIASSVEIQLLSIFKNHHIVEKPIPTVAGEDEWSFSNALSMNVFNDKR